jgi:hypothetical protein
MRQGFLEQLDPLRGDFQRKEGASGKVAGRSRQRGSDAELDGIAADGKEHLDVAVDLDRMDRRSARDDKGNAERLEFGNRRLEFLGGALRVTDVHQQVLPVDIAKLTKPVAEAFDERIGLRLG